MGKKQPKHALGNSAWIDALKRVARSIRPELEVALGSVAGVATKALLEMLVQ